jgi:hypothetical protein
MASCAAAPKKVVSVETEKAWEGMGNDDKACSMLFLSQTRQKSLSLSSCTEDALNKKSLT